MQEACRNQSVPKVAVHWNIQQTVHQWRSVSMGNCLGRTTMVLTIEERVFLVEHELRNGDKYTQNVQQKFAQQFPDAKVPHHNAVRNLINKFRETGSVQDAPRSGRPSTSEETVLDIQDRMLPSPSKSVRRLSQQAHVSKSTAYRILRTKLKLHPYRMSVVHQLKETDHQSRVDYCTWFQNFLVEKGEEILHVTFFTDEAWFHLSEYVNS
jgi:transposase